MGDLIKGIANWLSEPTRYTLGGAALLFLSLRFRRIAVNPLVFAIACLGITAFFLFAWSDPNFNKIITKPDNIPIVIMFATVLFFSWLALRRAYINDERIKRGEPTLEGELSKQKVFTWPDLVYIELICIVAFTALLLIWSIAVEAPIEEPASSARTPNPSKAPWYFLGLQELLVYFDPWIAGVLLPSFIVVGLMAIPYLDKNPKGNGYYTFEERPFAISFFASGFLLLWVSLVFMGTFLRGPNWSFFGPFEYWDHNKLEPMVNVDLSDFFWIKLLGMAKPGFWLIREAPGMALLGFYFVVAPLLLAKTLFKKIYMEIGPARYFVMMHLFLWFVLVPIKMLLRWTVSLKYIVAIPEAFLNV